MIKFEKNIFSFLFNVSLDKTRIIIVKKIMQLFNNFIENDSCIKRLIKNKSLIKEHSKKSINGTSRFQNVEVLKDKKNKKKLCLKCIINK